MNIVIDKKIYFIIIKVINTPNSTDYHAYLKELYIEKKPDKSSSECKNCLKKKKKKKIGY
jgi:hypothetical protein